MFAPSGRNPFENHEVVQQKKAQADRKQIEEAVVPGQPDEKFKADETPARQLPRPARKKNQERNSQLNREHGRH